MGLLNDCPEDILHLIIKTCSKNDLVKLSTINKRFHVFTEPHIYRTVSWIWEENSIPPITNLLRTIFEKPELAVHIRDIKLTGETFHLPPFRMKLPPRISLPDVERQRCVDIVRQSKIPNFKLWIDKLGGKSPSSSSATMDVVLAVLLSQLPNLTSLYLGSNFTKETTLVGAMFQHALCSESLSTFSKFKKLKEVHFNPRIDAERRWGRGENDQKPNNTLCPLTFFYAPSIQHITATIEEPVNFEWPSANPPIPAKLESLEITVLRERSLGKILSQCNNLHTLTYNFYADKACKKKYLMPASISSADLTHALLPVRPMLRSLALTCFITDHDYDGMEMEPEGIQSPITGFTEFSKLERLEVPFVFLLGNHPADNIQLGSVLPRSLKSLKLSDAGTQGWHDEWDGWGAEVLEVIETWLREWREGTPLLERMILEMIGDNREFKEFKTIGEGTGLEIVVAYSDDWRDYNWPRVFDRCSE